MQQDFTHYLITRYNVPLKNWARDKAGNQVKHDAWMQQRLTLFKTFCIPTIAGQTNQNFHWLIYVDPETNAEDLKAIHEASNSVRNAELRFAGDMEELLTDLRKVISNAQTDFIITSRLDNDDGLGNDYIRHVQDAFLPQHKTLINMLHGIMYDADERILTELRSAHLNHFTSLIENKSLGSECLTVLGFSHTQPPVDCVVKDIPTKNNWLKIIHGRNLNSRTKGRPVSQKKVLPYFNLAVKDIPVSVVHTSTYLIRKGIQRFFKQTTTGNQK